MSRQRTQLFLQFDGNVWLTIVTGQVHFLTPNTTSHRHLADARVIAKFNIKFKTRYVKHLPDEYLCNRNHPLSGTTSLHLPGYRHSRRGMERCAVVQPLFIVGRRPGSCRGVMRGLTLPPSPTQTTLNPFSELLEKSMLSSSRFRRMTHLPDHGRRHILGC